MFSVLCLVTVCVIFYCYAQNLFSNELIELQIYIIYTNRKICYHELKSETIVDSKWKIDILILTMQFSYERFHNVPLSYIAGNACYRRIHCLVVHFANSFFLTATVTCVQQSPLLSCHLVFKNHYVIPNVCFISKLTCLQRSLSPVL